MKAVPHGWSRLARSNPDCALSRFLLAAEVFIIGSSGAELLMQAWIMLGLAGLFEIAWAVGLKYAEGFSRPVPSVLTIAAMVASMYLLALAARTLPIGTAYAVWTGIGAVGAALLGMMLFGESASPMRLACIALIVAGIAGLKLSTPG